MAPTKEAIYYAFYFQIFIRKLLVMSYFNITQFSLVSHLFWFVTTSLSDCVGIKKELTAPSHPKTSVTRPTHVFPCFWSTTCIALTFDGYTGLSVDIAIG